jgi:hypothetical protein
MFRQGGYMKRTTPVIRLFLWFALITFVPPCFAGHSQITRGTEEDRDLKIFTDRVQEYIKMRNNLKNSLPAMNPTKDSVRIIEHQKTLAGKIVEARSNSRQGNIFTSDVTERFRKIIDRTLRGPEGRLARETIRPNESSRILRLHVNDVYPDEMPMTTTPPTLLSRLPKLPQELTYRIVGRDLVLLDSEARLVVDLIPKVIR